jgi:two-component system, OmpR family, sensor kinase
VSRLPLRRSLLCGMVALTTVALAVAGLSSVLAMRSYLIQRTDEQLHLAGTLAAQRIGEQPAREASDVTLRTVVSLSGYVIETRRDDGQLTRLSGPPDLPVGALLAQAPTPPDDGGVSRPATVRAGAYRVVSARTAGATVVVGLPLLPVDQTVARLVLVEVVGGAAVLALLAGFAWLLLARGLSPLEQITATATAIARGELDRRVPASGDPRGARTEVGRLTLAVNGMLGHIESALAVRAESEQRMRDFIADASHELRTPLTSIRGYLQLLRRGMVTVESRPDVLRRADEEAGRMAALVDDLLYLARLDAEPALHHEPVDLSAVVRDAVADALTLQPARPTELAAPPHCWVRGDRDALRQVMANLLANVRVHTPATAPVAVRVEVAAGRARVRVSDAGPGLPPEIRDRVFQRFTRADTSRGGSGLGLAIVAGIIAAHGGEVGLDSGDGAGTTVVFSVPTADS